MLKLPKIDDLPAIDENKTQDDHSHKQEFQHPAFQPLTLRRDFRNAAHPRKCKFITTIPGMLIPCVFDTATVSTENIAEISLNDILMFDQNRYNDGLIQREKLMEKVKQERSPTPKSESSSYTTETPIKLSQYPPLPTEGLILKSQEIPSEEDTETTGGIGQKVSILPQEQPKGVVPFVRTSIPTWKKSLEQMISDLGDLNMQVSLEVEKENEKDDIRALTTIKTTRNDRTTRKKYCESLVSSCSVSQASSRPVSIMQALDDLELNKTQTSPKINNKTGLKRSKSTESCRGVRSAGSIRSLGIPRSRQSKTVPNEYLDFKNKNQVNIDINQLKNNEAKKIEILSKSINGLEFTADMLMYLLCQIFQTTHERVVQEWLETASSSDKQYVVQLLKTAFA